MRVTKDGQEYCGTHITGPTHNLLVMDVQSFPNETFEVTVLQSLRRCSHGSPLEGDEVRPWISVGIERANAELGTTYGAKYAKIVANDSRLPEVYEELARRIVLDAHDDLRG